MESRTVNTAIMDRASVMFQRPISLILYVARHNCSDAVREFIRKQRRNGQIEIIYTIDTLCRRFRRNGKRDVVAVLCLASRGELEEIVQHSDLLCDHKILLVLPDRSVESASIGHALYPRFISYNDSDLQDVGWVLHKMLERD